MSAAGSIQRRFALSSGIVALLTLLVAAAGLRLYGLDWDNGHDLHPDELFVAKIVLIDRIHLDWPPDWSTLLDPARSGLNPRSRDPLTGDYREFAYGALPLLATDALAEVAFRLTGDPWHAPDRAYLLGRFLSALLDTLTVVVVYAVGARVFSWRVGLFAALFAALAPMSIQLAHYFTTDSWLTFFVALCLYAAVRAAEQGRRRWFVATGACFGLAMATKGSVFALAGLVAAAVLYDVWRRHRDGLPLVDALAAAPSRLAVAGIAAIVAFGVFEPYALVNPAVYLRSLGTQADIVRGIFDVPFTRQYVGTTPVFYQLEQLVRWGFGPVAGLLALAGVIVLGHRFWRNQAAGEAIVLAWFLGYGLVIAVPETKFLRYLAPLVPVLALTAGLALEALRSTLQAKTRHWFAVAVTALLLTGAGLWTIAFESIYAHENPRLAASRWIFANVPAGSVLSAEYWDDALPKPLGPGLTAEARQYQSVTMDLYADRPPAEAADEIYRALDQVDYVILSSNRVAAAIPRSPWRYPVQRRYYELLADGRLGFEPAAEFSRSPRLGPLRFDDRGADESFVNYDHPQVLIYHKRELVPRADYDQLMAWAVAQPWSPTRHPERPSLLLDRPVGTLPVVADARWSDRLTGNSLPALGVWLVLLVTLQVAGWPLASLVFGRFADAGWGFSRLVTLLVAGYLVWLGASLQLIRFRAVWAGVAVLAVAALGWAVWARRRRGRWWSFSPAQRPVAVGTEATFWLVFALFLLFRYLNPDGWHPIWGGEKPMEFAHLNATLRSAHFPPYDPWFADGYLNYYYYGLYLVAFCLKLTGIPSEIGFNLAQPTVIALLAAGTYSVAATLGRDATRRAALAIPGGLLGALFVVGIGNLTTLQTLLGPDRPPFDSFVAWTWAGSRAITNAITEFPFFTALYADLHAHVVALPMTVLAIALGYAIARDSRAPPSAPSTTAPTGARVVLAARLGLTMLVLGSLSATNAWDVPVYAALALAALLMATGAITDWRRRLAALAGGALLLGLGSIALFLPFHSHYVALFGSLARVRTPSSWDEVAGHLGGLLAVVVVGLVVGLLPRRSSTDGPLQQPVVVAFVVVALLAIAPVLSALNPRFGASVGAVLVVVVAALLALAVWSGRGRAAGSRYRTTVRRVGTIVGYVLVIAALARGETVLAAFLAIAGAAFALWLTGPTVALRYVALLVLAAAAVGAGTELVVVADDLIGTDAYRMNTIFKFYNQIWVLLALAAATLVATMFAEARLAIAWREARASFAPPAVGFLPNTAVEARPEGQPRVLVEEARPIPVRARWAWLGLGVSSVVVVASLLYPIFATMPRLHQRFAADLGSGTLNALDWMEYGTIPAAGADGGEALSFAGDRAAIDWLNRHVAGSPVIAEASIGPYRCNGSRFSIATGLPTIIGWERHQQQQRDPDSLPARVDDVRRLYASPDPAEKEAILRRYNVEYVVVGELERLYPVANNDCSATGSATGIAAFEPMVGSTLEIAFATGGTTIYRVRPLGAA